MSREQATSVEVPDSLDVLLTPEWLNGALSLRFPGIEVNAVTRGPIVERVSTNVRFHIECDSLPSGLSPDLCVKGYFSEQGRALGPAGEPEATFYRDLADATGVRTMRSVWADVHPQTRHGVVITEDVIAAGGEFFDALTPYSVDQVASTLGELARLHAFDWESSAPVDTSWLAPRIASTMQTRGLPEIQGNFDGPNGARVPLEVRDPQQLIDAVRVVGAREPGPGWTVIHGDTHVGNVFLDGDRRPSLTDWQLVQLGHWSIDVGYHIGSALEPAERASVRARPARPLPRAARERGRGRADVRCRVARVPPRRRVRVLPVGDHAVRQAGHHRGAAAPPRLGSTRSRVVRRDPRHVKHQRTNGWFRHSELPASISAG